MNLHTKEYPTGWLALCNSASFYLMATIMTFRLALGTTERMCYTVGVTEQGTT